MKKELVITLLLISIPLALAIDLSPLLDLSPFDASVKLQTSFPPEINISSEVFVCEDNFLSKIFQITDRENDYITEIRLTNPLNPRGSSHPFFVSPQAGQAPINDAELYSSISLAEEYVGVHKRTISALDASSSLAAKDIDITVIEKNDASQVSQIPVQTVYLYGCQLSKNPCFFYYKVQAVDEEDGNQDSENLTFKISFNTAPLFNISKKGVMDYVPELSDVGNYLITINTTDRGIPSPHPRIQEFCRQNGAPITNSTKFQLTISNQSTPPNITSYYPNSSKFSHPGDKSIYFNVSEYDAEGTLPDTYWYIDNSLKELDTLNLTDEFTYTFGCGVSGEHTAKVITTDGIFNVSVQWNITINLVACSAPPPSSSGGGGGGARKPCVEKWACESWKNCQNVEQAFILQLIDKELQEETRNKCRINNWTDEICGIQPRNCFDVNKCNTVLNRPVQIQECYFTTNPNCTDKIKNCHDGSCELLVDCGGPCEPCPTCTDGIQNQGEADIDCGGPCPTACAVERPFLKKTTILYLVVAIILIAIAIITRKLIILIKKNRELKEKTSRGKFSLS
ncbi:hypothetical protein J4402_02665 [Candidatus Pacearchaeota archaeon]|nr:hypothetical protein [Candidatus Pacearchaeota archaeon]